MSSFQFNKYVDAYGSEKKRALVQQMRRHLQEDVPSDYNIRTRQNCNMPIKRMFRYIKDK